MIEGETAGVEVYLPSPAQGGFIIKIPKIQHLVYSIQYPDNKNLSDIDVYKRQPLAKLKEYYRTKPALFQKRPINHPGPDIYRLPFDQTFQFSILGDVIIVRVLVGADDLVTRLFDGNVADEVG